MTYYDNTGQPVQKPSSIRPAVTAVILDVLGRVLLEKRSDNGFWGLPGGAVDIGESIKDALMREVLEETGLSVQIGRLIGIYSDPANYTIASYPDGTVAHSVVACFECETQSGEIRISDESTDIGYFRADALPECTLPGARMRIEDALQSKREPFIR